MLHRQSQAEFPRRLPMRPPAQRRGPTPVNPTPQPTPRRLVNHLIAHAHIKPTHRSHPCRPITLVPRRQHRHIAEPTQIHHRPSLRLTPQQRPVRHRRDRRPLTTHRQVRPTKIKDHRATKPPRHRLRIQQLPTHRRLVIHRLPMRAHQPNAITTSLLQQLSDHPRVQRPKFPPQPRHLTGPHRLLLRHRPQALPERPKPRGPPPNHPRPQPKPRPHHLDQRHIQPIDARPRHRSDNQPNSLALLVHSSPPIATGLPS